MLTLNPVFYIYTKLCIVPSVLYRMLTFGHCRLCYVCYSVLYRMLTFILPAYINITATAHTFRASQATFDSTA